MSTDSASASTANGMWLGSAVVAFVGAQAGVGTSTVVMAVADAAALVKLAGGVQVIDLCLPILSGLTCAADAQLGLDATRRWRYGRRGRVLVQRRYGTAAPAPVRPAAALVLLDGDAWAAPGVVPVDVDPLLVLLARATVAGLRAAETALSRLPRVPAAVALVGGPRRRLGLTAGVGPRVACLRDQGLVVRVPVSRRLERHGITPEPVPCELIGAGTKLLTLIGPSTGADPQRAPRSLNQHVVIGDRCRCPASAPCLGSPQL